MGRVWGAMASARLILLLLMATTCWKVGAAPWRAPGADDYTASLPMIASSNSAFVPEVEPGDVSGSEWGAESQPAPGSEALAGAMGMSWLFTSFASCQLTALISARHACRSESTALHVPAVSLHHPYVPPAPQLCRYAVTQIVVYDGKLSWFRIAEMPPERAVPNPQLLPALEPRWSPGGPARQRENPGQGRYSPRFAHVLKAMMGENEVPEVDGEPVDEAVFQEGSSHTLPISREGTEDVQAAGAAGARGEEHTEGIYIKDVPMFCLKGAIGVFVPLLLLIIVCCICIRRRRQKQQRLMESAKARSAAHGRSAREDRRSRHQRAPGRPARVLRSPSTSPLSRPKSASARLPPPAAPRGPPARPCTPGISPEAPSPAGHRHRHHRHPTGDGSSLPGAGHHVPDLHNRCSHQQWLSRFLLQQYTNK
ncbi:uncharacterized protein LOC109370915 isoform X2 [Meleagris gallopavo]|uniref:uncharacterized protein LOC109370915 isoform X2 n=1 Tax=Meleagris gallopavo TaxID=9103 RepID=UPI00093DBE88|nr:uncharacterized protein LOC109370915 isoform X2 [Meleagris gallopavo]